MYFLFNYTSIVLLELATIINFYTSYEIITNSWQFFFFVSKSNIFVIVTLLLHRGSLPIYPTVGYSRQNQSINESNLIVIFFCHFYNNLKFIKWFNISILNVNITCRYCIPSVTLIFLVHISVLTYPITTGVVKQYYSPC